MLHTAGTDWDYRQVNLDRSTEPYEVADHKTFDPTVEWVTRLYDQSDNMGDSNDYDDYNGYYRMSLAATKPVEYLSQFSKTDFQGSKWLPKNFFKRMYLRNLFNTTKHFITGLKDVDMKGLSGEKSMKNNLIKATSALKKADKYYESNQALSIFCLVEAIQAGKSVLERLKLLQSRGDFKV